jgi:hypothetical protein
MGIFAARRPSFLFSLVLVLFLLVSSPPYLLEARDVQGKVQLDCKPAELQRSKTTLL